MSNARELLILRHAKSSWKDTTLADHERPLNKRGRKAAKRMGQLLREEEILPDLIITSTAVRARDTARRVAEAAGYDGETIATADLYHASPADVMEEVSRVADTYDRVMVVGHNPGLEVLTGLLTGVYHRFPTAALLHVRFDRERWAETPGRQATLLGFWLPRLLMT